MFQSFIRDESGQAILEYVLLLLAVVSIVGTMKAGLKELTARFWLFMAKKIAAPCPTCEPSADVYF